MARTEIVTSVFLSDVPPGPEVPDRTVDPDFAATVAAGYVESDSEFAVRIGGQP